MSKNLSRLALAFLFCMSPNMPSRGIVRMQIFAKGDTSTPSFECLLTQDALPTLSMNNGKQLTVNFGGADITFESLLDIDDIRFSTFEGNILVGMKDEEATSVARLRLTYLDDHTVCIDGLEDGDQPRLYAADGKMLLSQVHRNAQRVSLSLLGLPKGVYIIKTNQQTFKILKKS